VVVRGRIYFGLRCVEVQIVTPHQKRDE